MAPDSRPHGLLYAGATPVRPWNSEQELTQALAINSASFTIAGPNREGVCREGWGSQRHDDGVTAGHSRGAKERPFTGEQRPRQRQNTAGASGSAGTRRKSRCPPGLPGCVRWTRKTGQLVKWESCS